MPIFISINTCLYLGLLKISITIYQISVVFLFEILKIMSHNLSIFLLTLSDIIKLIHCLRRSLTRGSTFSIN